MSRLARVCVSVMFAACLAPLLAQEPVHPERQRVIEEVQRKRTEMREGKIDRYNVRVRVRLKNGAKMQGVVKSGRFIERAEGIEFVESERNDPEAGIRIWYFDDTTSFIFLRWAEIDSHKIVAKLTDAEVKSLELEVAARERKRSDERMGKAAEGQGDAAKDGSPAADGAAGAATPGKPAAADGQPATGKADAVPVVGPLLSEFPPGDGWSEQKLLDLKRRMIVVGAFPSEKEKRFMDNFDEWKKQADAQSAAADASKAAAQTAGKAPAKPTGKPAGTPASTPPK